MLNSGTYTVRELHSNTFQSTGKLFIERVDNASFTITIPTEWQDFFGYMAENVDNSWQSTAICNIMQEKYISVSCDACFQIQE